MSKGKKDPKYRKPTHSDQLLNFNSYHPAADLLTKKSSHPSTSSGIDQENQRLKKVFKSDNYPRQLNNTSITFISIPYIKVTSEHIKRILEKVDIHTCFKNTIRQHLCHPEDAVPMNGRSGVVYCIPCRDCNFSYIRE